MLEVQILIAANLAVVIVAALRVRPSLLMIGANQLIVLFALLHISEYGQPESEAFNPAALFVPGRVAAATNLFVISSVMLGLGVLWPSRKVADDAQMRPLPVPPRWLIIAVVGYLLVAFISGRTILTNSYNDPQVSWRSITGSGITGMVISLVLYELYRRVRVGALRALRAMTVLVTILVLIYYLRGETGLAIGFSATGVLLLLRVAPRPPISWQVVAGIMTAMILTGITVRAVRSTLYSTGIDSVANLELFSTNDDELARTAMGPEANVNGTQYAAHILECMYLYDSGISRKWRSLSDPLFNTVAPSFLVGPLGLERPVSAASELQRYYISGGGSYVLGEFYWNGGLLCVVVMFALVVLFSFLCDTRYRSSFVWLTLLCQFAPGVFEGVGYGFAQVFRVGFNGLLVLSAYALFRRVKVSARPRLMLPGSLRSP